MNYPAHGRLLAGIAASLLLFSGSAFAQQTETKPAAEPATAAKKEEIVVLSPFRVSAEKDDGFVAANSLTGGRLATPLRDTPLAYSVLTRDFLDALTINDQEEALTWAVGSYRPLVSLSPFRYNDQEGGSSIISRGVQVSGAQRNFFLLGLNADTYSTERIDFARGPNALLIGTGGLGGVVSGMTKQASTDRAFVRIGTQFGSWDKYRATLDYNRPLTKNLALRVNVLGQDAKTWRNYEFDDRRGAHLAATYQPFRHTTVRAEYENYKQSALWGRESMSESISGWDGITTVAAAGTTAIANSDAKGVQRLGSNTSEQRIFIPGSDGSTVINWANSWRTMGGGATAVTPVGGILPLSTANLNINNGIIIDSFYSQDLLFGRAEASSFFRRPSAKTVIQPNLPTLQYGFDNYAFFVEHQQGEHIFFEAAINRAETRKFTKPVVSRLGSGFIDINEKLPDGRPNPNFKQVYSEAQSSRFHFLNNITEARAALAFVFDHTRWGDFRTNFLVGRREVHNDTAARTLVLDRNPDIRKRSRDDFFSYRYYWDDPNKPFTEPTSVTYVDPVAGTSVKYNVSEQADLRSAGTFRASKTVFTYFQGGATAKLLKGRLNLMGGMRRDNVTANNFSLNGNANNVIADTPADWDGNTIFYRPLAPDDFFKLKFQLKDASGNITGNGAFLDAASRPRDSNSIPLPQYAKDRFRDDFSSPRVNVGVTTITTGSVLHVLPWISAYGNYGESFRPPGSGITITGESLPTGTSDGYDYGVRLNLLGGRLTGSFGRYTSTQRGGSFDNTGSTRKIADILNANKVGDLSPNGENTRGLAPISTVTFDFFDAAGSGYEIDIVANLTRDWRLTANAAFPKNLTTNANRDQFAYLAANEATLKLIVQDAGVIIDANNVATVDLSVPVGNRSPDAAAAAAGWNNIQVFKQTNDPKSQSISDQPDYTFNVFTDYRISRGTFKNLRFGGGVQFIGKKAIGNRGGDTIIDPANPLKAIDNPAVDSATRIVQGSYYTVTSTISYLYKVSRDYTIDFNLRIGNVLNDKDLVYIGAGLRAPNGDVTRPDRVSVPTTFIYRQPRSFTLTATLSF